MTVIYLDELFLLNFVVDYLLLLAAGRLCGEVLRRGWLALGAAVGAGYAAAAFLPGMGFLLHPLCKLAAAVLALLAGYGRSRHLLRVGLVFFAVSAAFGGGIFALQLLGGQGLTLRSGILYSAMDLRLILLSAAGCYVVITFVLQRTARHTAARRELAPVLLTLEGRRVALTALVERENFQWIWAVLSGFDKHISLREVLAHPLPYADGHPGLRRLPLPLQHPLAQVEIVAWDSSLTLFFSREKDLTARFLQAYPQSQALEDYLQE